MRAGVPLALSWLLGRLWILHTTYDQLFLFSEVRILRRVWRALALM